MRKIGRVLLASLCALSPQAIAQDAKESKERKAIAAAKKAASSNWLRGDLEWDFTALETDDGSNVLGLTYKWEPRFNLGEAADGSEESWGLDIGLKANGTVATDSMVNPTDFLVTRLSLSNFFIWGARGATTRQAQKSSTLDVVSETEMTNAQPDAEKTKQKESYSFRIDVDLDAGYETNQDLTARQESFGLLVTLDPNLEGVEGWDTFWWKALNVLDLPFALIRKGLGGEGEENLFDTRAYLPKVTVGLDYINPDGADPRITQAMDRSSFWRLSADVGYRTSLGRFRSSQGDNNYYFFNARYRYARELEASTLVETNELDEHQYVALSIESDKGYFLTYKNGKLPFGTKDEETYEVGLRYNF